MNDSTAKTDSIAAQLCLACGLCCNGVIFADVKLQSGDDPARLQALGLPLIETGSTPRAQTRFPQPCTALDGCRCRIYPERPNYCRKFECMLFKNVKAGRLDSAAALRIIQAARQRADAVRNLLQTLGDTEEQLPLSARFRKMARRLENAELTEETAEMYGKLTLAVHDLNCLLSEAFYC